MDEQQPNPFPTGSPGGSPTGGGAADIPGVEVALSMVAATEAAARAAQKAVEMVESAALKATGDENKSWWKLLPKPPNFDHSTREAEISGWKEWSWMFEQYVASIDSRFTDDIQGVRARLDQPIDTVDFSDSERQRNNFLYSLLSSLLRQRALLVVKQVSGQNGLEAYRLLVQQNEPASKNRSMGLLSVIMAWPSFTGKTSLMQQVLKLEHAYSEYEKLGSKLSDDLKTAVLMRSVTGQLKTWLQLQVNEGTTYAKVREMILMYDTSTTRWSEQMVLGSDAAGSSTDGPVPMEIDRVESKGKYKGGSKGKSKDKNGSKGKSKGKQKGKEVKGKGKLLTRKEQRVAEKERERMSPNNVSTVAVQGILLAIAGSRNKFEMLALRTCKVYNSARVSNFLGWGHVKRSSAIWQPTDASQSSVGHSVQGCKDC